jgi:hypothetical protein
MMFMIPVPPTTSETEATAASMISMMLEDASSAAKSSSRLRIERGRVRNFDQLLGALRFIIEIAGNLTAADTKLQAVRRVRLQGRMTRCRAGKKRVAHWRRL